MSTQCNCPNCGVGMAPDAILCIECGFNRQTGKRLRTVQSRPTRHLCTRFGSYLGCLVVYLVLVVVIELFAFLGIQDSSVGIFVMVVLPLVLALIMGTMLRLTVTKNKAGRPVLITRWYVGFVPCPVRMRDLSKYREIRLEYKGAAPEAFLVRAVIGLVVLGVFGAAWGLMNRGTHTIKIAGGFMGAVDSDLKPVRLYSGPNERFVKNLASALEEIGGLRYG